MQLNCERSWNKSVIHKINDFWYCVSQHETKYFFPKKWFHFSVRFLFLSLQNNTVVITQPCTRLRPLRMNPILTFFGNIWLQSNRQKGRIRKQTRSQLPKIWYVIKPSRTVKIKMIFQRISRHSLILSKNILSSNYATKYTGKSLSEALLFAEHGENMLCTKIVLNVKNNFCTQHVLPKFWALDFHVLNL